MNSLFLFYRIKLLKDSYPGRTANSPFGRSMLLLLLCLFMAKTSFAQVAGVVLDGDTQEPVVGATVIFKGTRQGTLTDLNGRFSLEEARKDSVISISFIGYKRQEVVIGQETELLIRLLPQANELNEIVVTALGISRQSRTLGYSVSEIRGRELSETRDPNFINNLSGRIAGVQITNGASGTGSTARVVIRGGNSITGSNQPLFIVDGTPFYNQTLSGEAINFASGQGVWHEVDYGNGAAELNAGDIERVSVLKGPAAAALYGSRASNGAIVITTKSGKSKPNRIGLNYSLSAVAETPLVLPKAQNEYGAGIQGEFAFVNGKGGGRGDQYGESWGPRLDGRLLPQFDSPLGNTSLRGGDIVAGSGAEITPTPWVAQPDNISSFFETGHTLINSIAFGSGDENQNIRLAYTNLSNKGIIPNTGLKRNTFSLKTSYSFSDRLSATLTANYINSSSKNRPSGGYGSENPMYTLVWMGRQTNMESLRDYWQRGTDGQHYYGHNYAYFVNPFFILNENTNAFEKNRLLSNVALQYQIAAPLKLMLRNGVDHFTDSRESRRAFSTDRFPSGGFRTDDYRFNEINSDLLLTYEKNMGDFEVTVSAGANRMHQQLDYSNSIANELIVPNVYNFSNARSFLKPGLRKSEKEIRSVYSYADLGYKGLLHLNLSGRNDWSSTLPAGNNSYFYPSASVSGVISEMLSLPAAVSFWKVRGSVAKVGSDTDPYNLRNVFISNQPFGAASLITETNVLANSNLKPESLLAYEFGTDVKLFGGRLGLDATYYTNISRNQIFSSPLSAGSGYTNLYMNGGEVRNSGTEIMLMLSPLRSNNFSWNLTANFTRNVGKVVSLPKGISNYNYAQSVIYSRTETTVYYNAVEGQRLGDMYGTGFKKIDGQIVHRNGLPVADPELIKLGNYNPDFMVGLSNQFSYKNLQLSLLFDWRQGGVFLSRTHNIGSRTGYLEHTLVGREEGIIGEGVNEEGAPNTTRVSAQDYYQSYYNRSNEEGSVFDASYVKLRELKIGYTMPTSLFPKADIRLSLIGRNLLMWTENPHVDPETLSFRGSRLNPGVEDIAYPSTRSIGFSLNVGF